MDIKNIKIENNRGSLAITEIAKATGANINIMSGEGSAKADKEILDALSEVQKELSQTQPLIAASLKELHDALEKGDSSLVKKCKDILSTGVAVEVLKGITNQVVRRFLGIPGN